MARLLVLVSALSDEQHLRSLVEVLPTGQVSLAEQSYNKNKDYTQVQGAGDETMPSVSDGKPCVNLAWGVYDRSSVETAEVAARDECLHRLAANPTWTCAEPTEFFDNCKDLCGECGSYTCEDKAGAEACEQRLGGGESCSTVDTLKDCMLSCQRCEVSKEEVDFVCNGDVPDFKDILGSDCSYYAGVDSVQNKICDEKAAMTVGWMVDRKTGKEIQTTAGRACCDSCGRSSPKVEVDEFGKVIFKPWTPTPGKCEDAPINSWQDSWHEGCEWYGYPFDGTSTNPKKFDDETNCDRYWMETFSGKPDGQPVTEACCMACKTRNERVAAQKKAGTCVDDDTWEMCQDETCDEANDASAGLGHPWKCEDFMDVMDACHVDKFGGAWGRSADGTKSKVNEACCFACGSHGTQKGGAPSQTKTQQTVQTKTQG